MTKPKLSVQLRGGFSDRNGIKSVHSEIQTYSFDKRTRTALINATNIVMSRKFLGFDLDDDCQSFLKHTLSDVYMVEVDWNSSYSGHYVFETICETIRSDDYDSVLTLIEYIVKALGDGYFTFEGQYYTPTQCYNDVFVREYVGYRIVDKQIVPITDDVEISTIEESFTSNYREVKQHLTKAVTFLSDRNFPDYANSIKESISAVERMCSIIVGSATTLGTALKTLESQGIAIHPAMRSAFEKLYGYTSDSSGIRHSGQLGGKDSTFAEAKFMLVSCCAFINYLVNILSEVS